MIFSQYWESDFNQLDKENIDIETIKTVDDIFTEMLEYKVFTRYGTFHEYELDVELLDKSIVDGCDARKFRGALFMSEQIGTLGTVEKITK